MPLLNNIFKATALLSPAENIVELNTLNTRKNYVMSFSILLKSMIIICSSFNTLYRHPNVMKSDSFPCK